MKELIISGFGGQGILTAGLILIDIAASYGSEVSWCSSYGSEMRGGTANCNVIISEEEIGSPFVYEADILIAMNGPSFEKFAPSVKPGGAVLVNSSIVQIPAQDSGEKALYKLWGVPATERSGEIGNPRGANLIMLGAMLKATGLYELDKFSDAVDAYFASKGKTLPLNAVCLKAGYEEAILHE